MRFVHLLRKPLLLHGELDYGGPGSLGKRVRAPYEETTRIADGAVKVERAGRAPRQFALERAPELQALLTGFSALLGGDAATLQRYFAPELVENAPKWTLTLRPREPDLAHRLRSIVVDGRGDEPHCFALHEANGDASVMLLGTLSGAKLDDPPTPAQLDALCRAGP